MGALVMTVMTDMIAMNVLEIVEIVLQLPLHHSDQHPKRDVHRLLNGTKSASRAITIAITITITIAIPSTVSILFSCVYMANTTMSFGPKPLSNEMQSPSLHLHLHLHPHSPIALTIAIPVRVVKSVMHPLNIREIVF